MSTTPNQLYDTRIFKILLLIRTYILHALYS